MYQLTSNSSIILRVSDNAYIVGPSDSEDWLNYVAWMNQGNQPAPYITVEQQKQIKIVALTNECQQSILGGFTSAALGEPHHYDSDIEDQINIVGAVMAGTLGATIPYRCLSSTDEEKQWRNHTPAQLQQVFNDGVLYKLTQLQKLTTLKNQVNNCDNIECVNSITW
jgi:hypothetical protein